MHSRAPEDLDRLLAALHELDAYYRELPERRPRPQVSRLASPGHQFLNTTFGHLDLLGTLNQDRGYEEFLPFTVETSLRNGSSIRMLDLPTLIETKEAAGRDKDKLTVMFLRRTLEEKNRAQPGAGNGDPLNTPPPCR